MFVKLLVLLFANVFVSLFVLLCCRSLASKHGLKGGCNIPSPKGLGLLILFLTCKDSIRFIN
jgi:hypothetical protein